MKRIALGLGLVALAVMTAACSSGSGSSPAASAPAASAPAASAPGASAGEGIVVVAKDLKFSTATITAPADVPFQITLDNQEAAPHNVAIKDAAGGVTFKGEIVTSATVTYDVPALAAGPYEFFCEVHPEMKGTLTAE